MPFQARASSSSEGGSETTETSWSKALGFWVVAAGTHQELLHREGAYRRAALLQMVDDESRALLVEENGQVEAAL